MSPRTSFALHIVPALALPLIAFAVSSVGNVESFENWLLGHAVLTTRILPLLAVCVIGIAIMVHYFARNSDGPAFKAVVGGALIGFLVGILANAALGLSPLLVLTLTAIGATGGWAFLPRT